VTAFRLRAAGRTLITHRWIARVDRLAGRLEDLSPDRVLARGYSRTVLDRTGRMLTRAAEAVAGDLLRTQLAQGALKSRVVEKDEAGLAGGLARRMPQKKLRSDDGNRATQPNLFD